MKSVFSNKKRRFLNIVYYKIDKIKEIDLVCLSEISKVSNFAIETKKDLK